MVYIKFNSRKIAAAIVTVCFAVFVVIQTVNAAVYLKKADTAAVYDVFFNNADNTDNSIVETGSENDFSDGKGIISISCAEISGGGAVHIFVNGCIEASLKGGDSKTLRVAVGDVVLAMGYKLTVPVEVKLETAVGRFDCSIANTSFSVGNKGKLMAVIKKSDI